MVLERPQFLAAGHIPKFDQAIVAGAGEQLTIGTEGETQDSIRVSCKSLIQDGVGTRPEAIEQDRPLCTRHALTYGQASALVVESEFRDLRRKGG